MEAARGKICAIQKNVSVLDRRHPQKTGVQLRASVHAEKILYIGGSLI